jgi:hypothetical protein
MIHVLMTPECRSRILQTLDAGDVRSVCYLTFLARNQELKIPTDVKDQSPPTLADHLAGQGVLEEAVSQPRVNLGDDPAERPIASATA